MAAANPSNADVPQFFRFNIETANLDEAVTFYTTLLGIEGRRQAGSRCYFQCGPRILSSSSRAAPALRGASQDDSELGRD